VYNRAVLEEYDGNVPKEFKQLDMLTADNPVQQEHLDHLHKSLNKKITYMSQVIEIRRTHTLLETQVFTRKNARGLVLMQEIKGHIKMLRGEEQRLLSQRTEVYNSRNTTIFLLTIALVTLLATTMGVSIFSARHELNRRQTAEKTLLEQTNFQKAILDG